MKNAYTLIEIVIVIAIIGMMALVSIPAFGKYELKNNFESKAEEITSLFNRAYMLSQSPVRMVDGTIGELTCDSVLVELTGGTFTIILKRTSGGSLVDCVTTDASKNRIASIVVNDNTRLDSLSLSINNRNWVFRTQSMPANNSFDIESSKLNRKITFTLRSLNNIFIIKNDL